MRTILSASAALLAGLLLTTPAGAAEAPAAPQRPWSFNGIFGTFDRAAAQRGWQVYAEVCQSCHGLQFVAFRNLETIGFPPEKVQQIAAGFEVERGPNDEGEMFMAPATPADRVPSPFANEAAARVANNGAYPPDLSLIVEARKDGANYLHALLVGYRDPPPEGFELNPGMYYNDYFPGHQIAMVPPLSDDRVTYEDGTPATVEQMATDVTTFLAWASEPNLETRKELGLKSLLFILVLTGFLYALKRQIWSDVH